MKTARLFVLLTAFAAMLGSSFAQSTVTTEREVSAPATKTETRTYVKDGKTVTEKVVVTTEKEREASSKTYRAAIFVSNRAGAAYDGKVEALEDYVTSRVTDLGVSVISRETASDAVAKVDPGATANAIDTTLGQSTSALRLAQTLGADYVLQVTLTGYEANRRNIDAYGVKTANEDRTLRITYKILDGVTGGSLAADTVKASKTVQQGAGNTATQLEGMDELLDEASLKVATSLKGRLGRVTAPSAEQGLVSVTIQTEAADLTIPDIRIGVENTVTISESKLKVSALAATVEVDGIAVGTAPGTVTVKRGLSKLRITRAGFKPYERTVNFVNGQSLTVALELSEEGYKRWKDSTQFLNDLKNDAKLTDGEVKVLEGKAKMLEQSGFKVNTTAAPAITINEYDDHRGPRKDNKDRSLFSF
ncbi:PEGA domain-containing protein [Rariglobus hedericola]|uniref:PEGA domain-containing protein n=1 Tax=Rariglobus hedericola TaxID=2597822 RepID=A0A556QIX6_9BACT|nr:PEGA domain-containing protein [Rariglobus hedericola]TSJ76586.1 PEGA domain-containing protein [Rariglobus hedericola]